MPRKIRLWAIQPSLNYPVTKDRDPSKALLYVAIGSVLHVQARWRVLSDVLVPKNANGHNITAIKRLEDLGFPKRTRTTLYMTCRTMTEARGIIETLRLTHRGLICEDLTT